MSYPLDLSVHGYLTPGAHEIPEKYTLVCTSNANLSDSASQLALRCCGSNATPGFLCERQAIES
jgi:hypothetical protein